MQPFKLNWTDFWNVRQNLVSCHSNISIMPVYLIAWFYCCSSHVDHVFLHSSLNLDDTVQRLCVKDFLYNSWSEGEGWLVLIGDDETREEMSAGCECSQQASQSASRPVCGRTDARLGLVLFHNHHQFLLDHLLISSYVIKSQTHLVRRQEILESASAAGWATKLLQSRRGWGGFNDDNPT